MISIIYILSTLFGSNVLFPMMIFFFVLVDVLIIESLSSFFNEILIEK
jgi:hypothetical protein